VHRLFIKPDHVSKMGSTHHEFGGIDNDVASPNVQFSVEFNGY
jgi:hypothetical protein